MKPRPKIGQPNASVISLRFLKAFPGHETRTEIVSPLKPQAVLVNGKAMEGWKQRQAGGVYLIEVPFTHRTQNDTDTVLF